MIAVMIRGFVVYIALTKGLNMHGLKDPTLSSVEAGLDETETTSVTLVDNNQPLFQILKGGNDKPFTTVNLD